MNNITSEKIIETRAVADATIAEIHLSRARRDLEMADIKAQNATTNGLLHQLLERVSVMEGYMKRNKF